jgi:hypothetical protein
MNRDEQKFLIGFERAARLTQKLRENPPSHTSPEDYVEDVAQLHADSDDLVSRGLAVGCMAALGRE